MNNQQYINLNNTMIQLIPELEKKTLFFIVIDTLLVYLFTFIWFKFIHKDENALKQSTWYTVYITVIFMIYYYIFDFYWIKIY